MVAGNSRRKENIMSNYLPYNFYRDLFKFAQLQPREIGGKLLIKGWCHGSDQHCVWFDINDCTVECGVCGKMSFSDYIDKVYPVFAEEGLSMQDLYYTYWQTQHGETNKILEEMEFQGIEGTEEELLSAVEYYKDLCQEKILLTNLNREIKNNNTFFFRGQEISLKQGTKQVAIKEECAWESEEVETRDVNKYLWCWNGGEYQRGDFFEAAFGDYNKYKKKVVVNEDAAENLMRLSTTQRQKLLYDVLAAYYPVIEVDAADSDDLLDFCAAQKNQTANDTAMKLRWEDGLAKMVSFGLGISMPGAASMTWCYEVEELPTKRRYSGVRMSWNTWRIAIINKLQDAINDGLEYDEAWNAVRPVIYCQNKIRLTLCEADRMRLFGFVNTYLKNGYADWPEALEGFIGDDYEFIVDFYADFEIKEKVFFGQKGMRAAANKERGCNIVMSRFEAAFPDVKGGDILTTKQLKEAGYTDKKAIARLVKHEILENFAYGKYRVLWVS